MAIDMKGYRYVNYYNDRKSYREVIVRRENKSKFAHFFSKVRKLGEVHFSFVTNLKLPCLEGGKVLIDWYFAFSQRWFF